VGVLGTPVRDNGEAIEQEEQEGKADGDNGAGEKCIKWEIDGKRRQRGTRKSDNSATGTRFLRGQVGR
jgi:hypothetical protein